MSNRKTKHKSRITNNSIPYFRQMLDFVHGNGIALEETLVTGDTRLLNFIGGIRNGSFKSDSEASKIIFGEERDKRYYNLQAKLRQHITSSLFRFENSSKIKTTLQKINYRLNTEYAFFNQLISNGQKYCASYIGEHIIANSIRFNFNRNVDVVASELVEYYSINELNKNKVKYYKEVYYEYKLSNESEHLITLNYSEIMNMFVVKFAPDQIVLQASDELINKFNPILHKIHSVKFFTYFYLIKVFKYYSLRDFQMMDNSAEEGLAYFKKLRIRRFPVENMFLRKRVEANLILKDISLCNELLHQILKTSIIGSINWFNSLEILLTLHSHEQEYTECVKVFLRGKNHPNHRMLTPTIRTRWGLLEAYINFLQLTGAAPESPTMTRFRINKFINDTPQYSEDKKGRNIQLIIAQLLFYIIDKNWDKMEEKIDALQKYGTRYLRKNELFRSQVFIKMLLEIPKRMYHPKAILRHTAKYRKRLEEMAPNIDLNGSTLEIIPYEHLWELIIQNIVPPKYTRKTNLTNGVAE